MCGRQPQAAIHNARLTPDNSRMQAEVYDAVNQYLTPCILLHKTIC